MQMDMGFECHISHLQQSKLYLNKKKIHQKKNKSYRYGIGKYCSIISQGIENYWLYLKFTAVLSKLQ